MQATRRLLRQGSVYTLGIVIQLAAAALVVPILSRTFAPSQFGIIALALTIQLLLGSVAAAGLPVAITRSFYDDEPVGGVETSRQLIVSTVLVALLVIGFSALSAPLWIGLLAVGDSAGLVVGIALALPAAISAAALALLRVQERPAAFLAVTLISSVGAQLLGLGALAIIDGSAESYLIGYGSGIALGAGVGLVLAGVRRSRPASRPLLRASIAMGLPTIPIDLSALALSTGDRLVIQVIDGSAAVGRYQIAYAIGTLALTFLSALNVAWLAITFGLPEKDRWPALAETTTLVAQLGLMFCAFIALTAPLTLSIMAPPEYAPRELVPVTAIVALAALPWSVFLPCGQILVWHRHTRPLLWITPLALVLNFALIVVLLPVFGLPGAAAATFVALCVQSFLTYREAGRLASVPWDRRGITICLASGVLVVAVAIALPGGVVTDVIRGVGAAAVALFAVRTIRLHLRPPMPRDFAEVLA